MEKTLEYPLSPRYIPDWNVTEALRELIANALDTESRVNFKYDGDKAIIEDKADGIPQSYWVLGEGKHGNIGQFGEGLKMAMLVLAREEREVVVETVGYTVSPSIRYSEVYESDILLMQYGESQRESGTRITLQCSGDEYGDSVGRFLKLNPKPKVQANLPILDDPGQLYINGVWVQSCPDMIWGYNFEDKAMANRDRSVLDMGRVRIQLSEILSRLTRFDAIVRILELSLERENRYKQEMMTRVIPYHRAVPVWRKAFRHVFGRQAVVTSERVTPDRELRRLGWYVVSDVPYGILETLRAVGIETSEDVLRRLYGRKFTWPQNPLTDHEVWVLKKAKRIASKVVPSKDTQVKSTRVVEEFPYDSQLCSMNGLYRDGKVYLRRSCLSDIGSATGTLIHERLHGMGFLDADEGFESKMTEVIGQLAAELHGGKEGA